MIRHVIAVTSFVFPDPGHDDEEFGGYLDTVTTALWYDPSSPRVATMTTDRQDRPGVYDPIVFPLSYIEDLLEGSQGGDDSAFVMARAVTDPDWVFVNHLDRPPVYARLRLVEEFLAAVYVTALVDA